MSLRILRYSQVVEGCVQSLTPPTPVPTPVPGQAAGSLCSCIREHVRAALQVVPRQSSPFQTGHTLDKDKKPLPFQGDGQVLRWNGEMPSL